MKIEILKFHYEEMVYALNIMATNLKKYHEEDLMNFAEAIHRFDSLANPNFLITLEVINPHLNNDLISKILHLKSVISQLFSSLWYKKLVVESALLDESYVLSTQLLKDLGEEYIEPTKYADQSMDVNW
jgi:hypothetical protein